MKNIHVVVICLCAAMIAVLSSPKIVTIRPANASEAVGVLKPNLLPQVNFGLVDAIIKKSDQLVDKYGPRPYYTGPLLAENAPQSLDTAVKVLPYLIACESEDRSITIIDSNGLPSAGILMFQDWPNWERMSGYKGDPLIRYDAVMMGIWAIEHGYIGRWSCAGIVGIL